MNVKMLRTLADRYLEAIQERRQIGERLHTANAELSELKRQDGSVRLEITALYDLLVACEVTVAGANIYIKGENAQ